MSAVCLITRVLPSHTPRVGTPEKHGVSLSDWVGSVKNWQRKCGRNFLYGWSVLGRKTLPSMLFVARRGKRKGRAGAFLYFSLERKLHRVLQCVYPQSAFPAPPLLLLHTVVVAAITCCPFRPCALLFCYQFYFKASHHRFPRIKFWLPQHPPGGFYQAGAIDKSPKHKGPCL